MGFRSLRRLPAINGLPAQGESECNRDSPDNSADLSLLEPDMLGSIVEGVASVTLPVMQRSTTPP